MTSEAEAVLSDVESTPSDYDGDESDWDRDDVLVVEQESSPCEDSISTAPRPHPGHDGVNTNQAAAHPPAAHWEDITEPILDAGPLLRPPPDYAAAVANREEEERQFRERILRLRDDQSDWTLSAGGGVFGSEHPLVRNGIVGERGGPGVEQAPSRTSSAEESTLHSSDLDGEDAGEAQALMGNRDEESQREAPLKDRRKRSRYHYALIVLGLVVVAVVLWAAARKQYAIRTTAPSSADATIPESFDLNRQPLEVAKLPHSSIAGCDWRHFHSIYVDTSPIGIFGDRKYTPPNVTFTESIANIPANLLLSGTFRITKAKEEQKELVRYSMEVATTDGHQIESILFDNPDDFTVNVTGLSLVTQNSPGCMDLSVVITIRGTDISTLAINTTNLDVELDAGNLFQPVYDPWGQIWNFGLAVDDTQIWAEQGNVTGSGWWSRETSIHATKGSLTGDWPLRDSLVVNTHKGDINIGIEPLGRFHTNPVLPDRPFEWSSREAKFSATSEWGSIRSHIIQSEEAETVPNRDYLVHVETQQGNVDGDFLLGVNTSIITPNGTTNVRVVPVDLGYKDMHLNTEHGNSEAQIWVMRPAVPSPTSSHEESISEEHTVSGQTRLMSYFHATHKSNAGGISYVLPIHYWSGTVEMESESGFISVEDSYDVKRNLTSKLTVALGDGGSTVELSTVSGWIDLMGYQDYGLTKI